MKWRFRLIVVGHLGFAKDATPHGSAFSLGGSAYACARGAAVIDPREVGVLARVGEDFDLHALKELGVDLQGVNAILGDSPVFSIRQYADGHRTFESSLGVAVNSGTEHFPDVYASARHFHLATMPPLQQADWLRFLRLRAPEASVSVDMFEPTAAEDPELCRALCLGSDLIFLNQVEYRLLFDDDSGRPRIPMILKRGAEGAWYVTDGSHYHAPAPRVDEVDTTGAGEIVAGVFLSLRTLGLGVADALRHAVSVASAKVSEFGVDGKEVDNALGLTRDAVKEKLKRL